MAILLRDFRYQKASLRLGFLSFILLILLIIASYLSMGRMLNLPPVDFLFFSILNDGGEILEIRAFKLPIGWFLLHLIPVFSQTLVLYKDHVSNGLYILPKLASKRRYFFSKIAACFFIQLLFWLMFTLGLSLFFLMRYGYPIEHYDYFLRISISYLMESFLFSYLVFSLSLFLPYRSAIAILFLQMSIAMLSNIPYLLGQTSLAMRQDFLGGSASLTDAILCWGGTWSDHHRYHVVYG